MCMKNLNATIITCADVPSNKDEHGLITYKGVFDFIVPQKHTDGDTLCIDAFDVIINMSAIFDGNQKQENNCIGKEVQKDEEYICALCANSDESSEMITLGVFPFKAAHTKPIMNNRSFFDATFKLRTKPFDVSANTPQLDLMLLIKNNQQPDGKWTVQTIKRLFINRKADT